VHCSHAREGLHHVSSHCGSKSAANLPTLNLAGGVLAG
jgi:hypothetical protein